MKLALVTNKPYSSLETFIKAQIDNLPFEKEHFWGFKMPFQFSRSTSFKHRVKDKFIEHLRREKFEDRMKREFKRRKINVVLAQYGMLGSEVLPICKSMKLPLIVHFHGHDAVRNSVIVKYGERYREMFSYSGCKVVSVSAEMTKRLVKIGCPQEKIYYNVYGPDDKFLDVQPQHNKLQFVGIGRFVEKKAPHLTILAFKNVVKRFSQAQLILAGDGELLESCKDLVQALELENSVTFPGRISPSGYRKYLEESIAFVQHSIEAQDGDMEGTPVAILEASAAGLPIISTRHGGIPDVVEHGSTGLLCAEKDINTMAENMIWVLENKDKAIAMGAKGKKRVSANYNMNIHIKKLSEIIRSAASN